MAPDLKARPIRGAGFQSLYGGKILLMKERIVRSVMVDPETGCWYWQLSRTPTGYGKIKVGGRNGKTKQAHRVSYEAFVGPIPDGYDLDHLCRHPACVNPEHLEPVTRRENLLRGDTAAARRSAQTHCCNGHPFTPDNTVRASSGGRECRACRKARAAAWRSRHAPSFSSF